MTDNRPACAVCGGTDYCVEAGFYYCSECHTQSQDIREEVFETWNTGNDEISRTPSKKGKKRKVESDPDREWTTWEAYNWILKGLVDEVIELGAKPSLKEIVLQLWTSYLRKMGIAFTSKKNQDLPRLAVDFDLRDASLICGIKFKSETSSRKSSSCKSVKSTSSVPPSVVSSNSTSSRHEQKRKFLHSRRKLMVAEAERVQQDVEAALDFSSQLEQSLRERESSVETISIVSCSSRSRAHESENLLKQRKRLLKKICGERGMYKGHKRVGNSVLRSTADPNYLCRTRLLNFVHLGLLIDCNEQQLSDLLRWMREGHLSFQHVTHFFPDGIRIVKNDRAQFAITLPYPQYYTIIQGTRLLTEWLGVKYLPVPDVHKLVERQVHELGLPDMMITLVEQLSEFIPVLPIFKKKEYFYSFEVQTMAMIIFVLKLLLGLDGRTEHRISETADRLNELYAGDNPRLFSWVGWVCWFERRKQLLIRHHIPTRDLIDPREQVDIQQLIEQWKRAFKDERLSDRVKSTCPFFQAMKPQSVEILKQPLLLLEERCREKSSNMYFPATLNPLSTYSTIIITHMCPEQQDSLWKNFSTSDMNFMLDPSEVVNFAESNNIKLKILRKSTHSSFKKLSSIPRRCRRDETQALISVVPIEVSKMRRGRRRKKTELTYLHCRSSKEEKRFSKKKVQNSRKSNNANNIKDKHPFSRNSNSCKPRRKDRKKRKREFLINSLSQSKSNFLQHFEIKNNFRLQSKVFLKFHIKTVSENSSITRQPTLVEKSEVGLATIAQRKSVKKLKKKLLKGITRSGKECLKLYLPYRHYWICRGAYEKGEISEEQFESTLRKLPTSFSWLLQECARILEVEKRFLYCELLRVEGAALCIES